MREEEYQSDLQMKDSFDVGLEIKVLDLLLENSLLKDQIASSSLDTTNTKNPTTVVIDRNAQQHLKNEIVPSNSAIRRHQQSYHFKSEECYEHRTPATSDEFSSSFFSRRDGVYLTQSSNVENESSHSLTLNSFPSSHAIGHQQVVKDVRPRYYFGSSIISSLSKLMKGIRVISCTKKHPKHVIVSFQRDDMDLLDSLSDLSS